MLLKSTIIVLAFLLFIQIHSQEQPYNLVIHNTIPTAKCLDGSSPGLYLHEGGDHSKILVFFVGGGYCAGSDSQQVLQQCYQRTKTEMGTSKVLPQQIISPGGYLSTNPSKSRFANWTKVIINYCDGAQHQGHNNQPISYKDTYLYFRGADNTRSHFTYLLQKHQLADADRVLLTGASAGGIATIYWSNFMRSLLKKPQGLSVVADSGIFANVSLPNTNLYVFDIVAVNLFKISNIDQKSPIQACNLRYPGQQYKCVFVQYSYEFLENKILFINSEYDAVGLKTTLNIRCIKTGVSGQTIKYCNSTEMNNIEGYRSQYLKIVSKLKENGHSFWTIACCRHSYACYKQLYNEPTQRVPMLSGLTVQDAVNRFVFDKQNVQAIDSSPWPSNEPCAF